MSIVFFLLVYSTRWMEIGMCVVYLQYKFIYGISKQEFDTLLQVLCYM